MRALGLERLPSLSLFFPLSKRIKEETSLSVVVLVCKGFTVGESQLRDQLLQIPVSPPERERGFL